MKNAIWIVVISIATIATAAHAQVGDLQIHTINVQQGDCTLVVGPDGTTLLVDGGKTDRGVDEIIPYLQSIGIDPSDGLDYVVATHRDEDHIGGLDEVINAGYDVRFGVWDNGSSKADSPGRTDIADFLSAAQTTTAEGVSGALLGSAIMLGYGARATVVAVGGRVMGLGTVEPSPAENDQSVVLLVQYGAFDYIVGGDLGGGDDDSFCTGRSTSQANIESSLAQALVPGGAADLLGSGGIEVLHVNHHGSESSTNSDYMNLLTPRIAVINTGADQGPSFHHPRADVVEQVLMAQADCVTAPPALVLQTEDGQPSGSNTSFRGFACGDIVIRTDGVSGFTVLGTGQVSQGPDERVEAGVDAPAAFPLDSEVPESTASLIITEIMIDPSAVTDAHGEWFEVSNPGLVPVDIEGWVIADDDNDRHRIASGAPLLVNPNQAIVLARSGDESANGGFQADYVYSGFNLANGADEVILMDANGVLIDAVRYVGAPDWPVQSGRSMALTSLSLDNAVPSSWNSSEVRGGTYSGVSGDRGTPGEAP